MRWITTTSCTLALVATATAQEDTLLIRTESPRATLESFLRLRDAGEQAVQQYWDEQSRANYDRVLCLLSPLEEVLDLSSVPAASRQELASDTIDSLLDIFGRQDLPPLESVPDVGAFGDPETLARWRIPRTPIWIVRVDEGPREGEFLFGPRTVDVAPAFYERIRHVPLRSSLDIDSWTDAVAQLHGPLIPAGLVIGLPDGLKRTWLGTPVWKILTVLALSVLAVLLLVAWHRLINRRAWKGQITGKVCRLLTPVMTIVVIAVVLRPGARQDSCRLSAHAASEVA